MAEFRAVSAVAWIYHRLLLRIPLVGHVFRRIVKGFYAWRFARDLRRLHDVLAGTDLAGHYWVWCGLLLGWAREGRPLRHDLHDADFCVLAEALPLLEAAVPALRRAGFLPLGRARATDGSVASLSFARHRWRSTRIDFSVIAVVDDQLRYFNHGSLAVRPVEIECRLPVQELVPFDFLRRTWLRHANADLELTAMYGDWRTPRPMWFYLVDDRAAFCCRIWAPPPDSSSQDPAAETGKADG